MTRIRDFSSLVHEESECCEQAENLIAKLCDRMDGFSRIGMARQRHIGVLGLDLPSDAEHLGFFELHFEYFLKLVLHFVRELSDHELLTFLEILDSFEDLRELPILSENGILEREDVGFIGDESQLLQGGRFHGDQGFLHACGIYER